MCSHDFSTEHSTIFEKKGADVPFLFSFSKFDFLAFTKGGRVVVADRNYQQIFQSNEFQGELRGLIFDLHDKILVFCTTNKLKQIRWGWGGGESRETELAGISDAYNVVLHSSGETVMVLDYGAKCIYQVL